MRHTQAAEQIRNLGNKFSGFLEVAAFLEKLGSLDDAKGHAEEAARVASDKLKDIQVQVISADLKLTEANSVLEKARADVASVVRAADERAAVIVEKAKSEAVRVTDEANAKRDAAQAQVRQEQEVLSFLRAAITESKSELTAIKGQISETKAKIGAL